MAFSLPPRPQLGPPSENFACAPLRSGESRTQASETRIFAPLFYIFNLFCFVHYMDSVQANLAFRANVCSGEMLLLFYCRRPAPLLLCIISCSRCLIIFAAFISPSGLLLLLLPLSNVASIDLARTRTSRRHAKLPTRHLPLYRAHHSRGRRLCLGPYSTVFLHRQPEQQEEFVVGVVFIDERSYRTESKRAHAQTHIHTLVARTTHAQR